MIVDHIDGHRQRFGVEPICAGACHPRRADRPEHLLGPQGPPVHRRRVGRRPLANAALDVWRANRSLYGADKLAIAMRKAGHDVGRDHVARLMKILGIEGVRRDSHRTVTTRRDPTGSVTPT